MRAIDYLDALVAAYNGQANADKNEVALKTEEFINGRLEKIDAELGTTEGALESYKKRNRVTELSLDASQSVAQEGKYSAKLSEANSQIQLIDYLREFVDNPANKYEIIPSNVGLTDQASVGLIKEFNQIVLDRNRLLKSVSEQAPQVPSCRPVVVQISCAMAFSASTACIRAVCPTPPRRSACSPRLVVSKR